MATLRLQGNFGSVPVVAKVFLLAAILAVLSSGYYLSIHMSLSDEIKAAQEQNQRLQVALQQARARQKEYLELREELANREALDRQNLRILPEDPEIPALLGDLNRLSELSGLIMKHVQPRPEKPEEFYVSVPLSLGVSGKYHQLAKFFYNVSRLERAVNMENLKLDDPTRAGEDIVLNAEVLATTFRRKPQEGQ